MDNEFRLNAGCLSLDLSATVRRRASRPADILEDGGATDRWLMATGLVDRFVAVGKRQVEEVVLLREAVHAVAEAIFEGAALPVDAVTRINEIAARRVEVPQLDARSGSKSIKFGASFDGALSKIAIDAIELFGGSSRNRISRCQQAECGMLFFDGSRGRRRRWCSMDRCGSRAKAQNVKARRGRHEGNV
jgi:predicted RNA-binding Zn ribbon-like protein